LKTFQISKKPSLFKRYSSLSEVGFVASIMGLSGRSLKTIPILKASFLSFLAFLFKPLSSIFTAPLPSFIKY